jgi:hypothetical protein
MWDLRFESNGNWDVLFPLHGRAGEAYTIGQQSVVVTIVVVAACFVFSDSV